MKIEEKTFVGNQDCIIIKQQYVGKFPIEIYNRLNKKESYGQNVLKNNIWSQLNLSKYCSYIEQWPAQKLMITDNNQPQLLKHLHHIKFENLVNIVLWRNNIVSIEGFCRIYMPNIKELWINKNHLNCVNQLRKMYCPFLKLKGINLSSNCINEYDKFITEICLNVCSQKIGKKQQYGIKNLVIEEEKTDFHQMQDLRCLVKIQRNYGRGNIWLMSQTRINNESLQMAIKKKLNTVMILSGNDDF